MKRLPFSVVRLGETKAMYRAGENALRMLWRFSVKTRHETRCAVPRCGLSSASCCRFASAKFGAPGRKGSRIVAAFVVRACIVPVLRCRNRRLREIPTRSGCASFSATEQKRGGEAKRQTVVPVCLVGAQRGSPVHLLQAKGVLTADRRRCGSAGLTACWVGRMVRRGPHGAEWVGSCGRHGSDDAMRAACFLRVCRKSRFVRGKKRCRRAPWLYRRTPPSIRFPEALLYLQNRIIFPLD